MGESEHLKPMSDAYNSTYLANTRVFSWFFRSRFYGQYWGGLRECPDKRWFRKVPLLSVGLMWTDLFEHGRRNYHHLVCVAVGNMRFSDDIRGQGMANGCANVR